MAKEQVYRGYKLKLMTPELCKELPGCHDRYRTEHILRTNKHGWAKLERIAAAQGFSHETWMDGDEYIGFITDNEYGPRFAVTTVDSSWCGEVWLVEAK